jgi:hypothetical protein
MRAGHDQKRRIVHPRRIDVDTQRQHPLQYLEWRHDVLDAAFDRPVRKARRLNPRSHGDGAILVPGQRQFFLGDLSNKVARTGRAARPRIEAAIALAGWMASMRPGIGRSRVPGRPDWTAASMASRTSISTGVKAAE